MSKKSTAHSLVCFVVVISLLFSVLLSILASAPVRATDVGGQITSDTTWIRASSPYFVSSSVDVKSGVTLTIEPGVVVKFGESKVLQVNGTMIAKGTEAEGITFTSNQDSPSRGYWGGIEFTDSSIDTALDSAGNYVGGSTMQYCTIQYSGASINYNNRPGIKLDNCSPFIDHCDVKNNYASGIVISKGAPRISNCTITNNYSGDVGGGGIRSMDSSATISGNIVCFNYASGYDRGAGIYCAAATAATIVSGNTVSNNSGGGIYAYAGNPGRVTVSGNTISNNSAEFGGGIWASGSVVICGNTIDSNKAITGVSCAQGGGLLIEGGVVVCGNAITSNSVSPNGPGFGAGLYIRSGQPTVTLNEISGNISPNNRYGAGIYIYAAQPSISYNNIYNNDPINVYCNGNFFYPDIDASNNWWGSDNETAIQGRIWDWSDDAEDAKLLYKPFLAAKITDFTPFRSMEFPSDWANKELFSPVFYRPTVSADTPQSPETLGTVRLGVHNKRDMWYVVKVYTRKVGQSSWSEYHPKEWQLPYLGPWAEKNFSYIPDPGEEVKLEVRNDLNDDTLKAIWELDFAMRALLGISLSPQVTDPQAFVTELMTFHNEYLQIGTYLSSGQYDDAVLKLAQTFAAPGAQGALYHLLMQQGFSFTTSWVAAKFVGMGFSFIVNGTKWWDFIHNTTADPYIEEVVLTAKAKGCNCEQTPTVKVTETLSIISEKPYYPGETLTAQFTVANNGAVPITLTTLTAGGRGPNGDADVHDFSLKSGVTLAPGAAYDYEGNLHVVDPGSYHFFVAYRTPDGEWNTNVPVDGTVTNTLDVSVSETPEKWLAAELCSPGELRVYDSQRRVSGLVGGETKNEIPHSAYVDNRVLVLAPSGPCTYRVVGTDDGSYGLRVMSVSSDNATTFTATEIPISNGVVHEYAIDWDALIRGENGVTLQIDSNGDGVFEKTMTTDSDLTRGDFASAAKKGGVPFWIWIIVGVGAAAVVAAVVLLWRRMAKKPVAAG